VRADPRELEEALVNLAINAKDAMPDGGRLDVAVATHGGADTDGRVTITVSDTGCGMDDETRERLFEPFYTTKGPDHGTGLGLALVYGIVRRCGGEIVVDSAVGEGTRVTMTFPLRPSDAAVAATLLPDSAASEDERTLDGEETILLVEGDEELREVLVQRITDRGYTVLEAGTADRAVAIARDWTEPLHLVLMDSNLPDRPGEELVAQLRAMRPDLPVVYMIGQRHDPGHGSAPVAATLGKPFRIATLMRHIRTSLEAARPGTGR
jgi:two-component system cell cycle sensor histidine kinase/response regulator CckA